MISGGLGQDQHKSSNSRVSIEGRRIVLTARKSVLWVTTTYTKGLNFMKDPAVISWVQEHRNHPNFY